VASLVAKAVTFGVATTTILIVGGVRC
jgi:hypothetical protein